MSRPTCWCGSGLESTFRGLLFGKADEIGGKADIAILNVRCWGQSGSKSPYPKESAYSQKRTFVGILDAQIRASDGIERPGDHRHPHRLRRKHEDDETPGRAGLYDLRVLGGAALIGSVALQLAANVAEIPEELAVRR